MNEKLGLELLKQALPTIVEKFGQTKEEFEHYSSNKLIPYILERYESLNESTSQLFRNEGYRINELYVPLTLASHGTSKFKIDSFPRCLLLENKKILIKDSAGMGKSTILKMLFRYSVDSCEIIPFYIDLKSLLKNDNVITVEDYILESFPRFKKVPSKDFLLTLLEETPYLFLFDGADEVPDKFKKDLFDSILRFCSRAKKCNFIVATRDEDKILSSFNSFESFYICPLEKKEAYTLLKKYQFKDVKADDLIKELEKDANRGVTEFLKNPLLTTLLYTAYAYKRKVPLKKNLFFSQIFEALYENHDATKIGYLTREKKSGLDIDSFEKILAHLAYISRVREKLEYSKQELLALVADIAKAHPTINFNIRGFIDDLVSSVPVLRRDGLSFTWQHKSIQEYLFVRFLFLVLSDEKREETLAKIIEGTNAKRYRLVLDIVFDENEELFHKVITNQVIKFWKKNSALRSGNLCQVTDSMNIFYRYIYCKLAEIMEADELEEFRSSNYKNRRTKFDKASKFVTDKFNVADDMRNVRTRISWNKKIEYWGIYESSYVVCLSVMHDKGKSFVSKYSFDKTYEHDISLIHNFDRKGNIEDLQKIEIADEIFTLDIKSCQEFISQLEAQLEKRNNALEMYDI